MSTTPEFSRLLEIESIVPDRERIENVVATPEECVALAKRFDLRELENLKSRMTLIRVSEGDIVRIKGELSADVVQACVVSLQDVPSQIKAEFDTCFTKDGEVFEDDLGIELDDEDEYEVMNAGKLDLGELVAQYLSLELDPYPRAPGVSLAAQMAELGGDKKIRPFDILQKLKTEKEE